MISKHAVLDLTLFYFHCDCSRWLFIWLLYVCVDMRVLRFHAFCTLISILWCICWSLCRSALTTVHFWSIKTTLKTIECIFAAAGNLIASFRLDIDSNFICVEFVLNENDEISIQIYGWNFRLTGTSDEFRCDRRFVRPLCMHSDRIVHCNVRWKLVQVVSEV